MTQFDSATGDDTFRADVGAKNKEYDTNTILSGDQTALANLVEDDEFRAKVVVTGSMSYETTLGGDVTVPQLDVRHIEVL